jgi:predicted aspartyl protease
MRRWMIGLIMVCLLFPEVGLTDIYYWIDDQGIQNYTERFESVPEGYRSNVQVLSLPPAPPAPPELKPSPPPKGPTRIPFSPGSPVLVNAKINGIGPVTLILDTGSERTIISPLVLSRLGLPTENAPPITLKGVTGMGYADRVWVNFIEVGEIRVGPLLIVVYATDLKGADGLLGRDFLSGLHVTIDSKEKIVTLTPNY